MPKVQSPSGRLVEAVPVDFEATAEPWSTYELADGTVLKMRTTPQSIIRLEGEHDAHGNPGYQVNSATIVRIVKAGKGLRGEPTMPTQPQAAGHGQEVG